MTSYVETGYVDSDYAESDISGSIYPYDPSGSLRSNKIINEQHNVNVHNGINAYLIVPIGAPFFGTSLSITNATGITLIENVDYYLTQPWEQASNQVGSPIYGSITLLTGYAPGFYRLNYQTLGGYYVDNPLNTIQSGLIAANNTYLTLDLSTVPQSLPPTPHTQDLNSISGMTEIYRALYTIANAVKSPKTGVHYNDVAGMVDTYAVGTLEPILQILTALAVTQRDLNDFKSLVVDLFLTNSNLLNVDKTLDNYEIPLFGVFKIKVGKVEFNVNNQPATITVIGDPFTNCLYYNASIYFTDPSIGVSLDEVRLGTYNSTTGAIPITVSYNEIDYAIPDVIDTDYVINDPAPGNRTISYFAIGI